MMPDPGKSAAAGASRLGSLAVFALGAALLAACSPPADAPVDFAPTPPNPPPPPPLVDETQTQADPVQAFLAAIASHCGSAFAGRITANQPPAGEAPAASDPFEGQSLVMHVRECAADELRIPFHVGDDHSRTWILRRVGERLELKHDHRHADGSPDAVTFYGGTSSTPGSASRQEFPVDAESQALFAREGLQASLQNTWAMQVEPGQRFIYELSRPSGRLFRVEFDLGQPVALPPVPWGHE